MSWWGGGGLSPKQMSLGEGSASAAELDRPPDANPHPPPPPRSTPSWGASRAAAPGPEYPPPRARRTTPASRATPSVGRGCVSPRAQPLAFVLADARHHSAVPHGARRPGISCVCRHRSWSRVCDASVWPAWGPGSCSIVFALTQCLTKSGETRGCEPGWTVLFLSRTCVYTLPRN